MKPYTMTAKVWDHKGSVQAGHAQYVDATIEVVVDWDRIAQEAAEKAYRNKSRKTGMLGGAIKAKLVKLSKTEKGVGTWSTKP